MNDATDELLRRVNELEEKLRECAARERNLKEWKEKGEALLAENTELRAYVEQLTQWKEDGEAVFSGHTLPMFALGAWWADRPWRKK